MPGRARVTTRTGDSGETSLFSKDRVRKTDPRIEALGDLDEAQAALGLARATIRGRDRALVLDLQRGLYLVMAEVATPERTRLKVRIDPDAVADLDALVERLRERAKVEGRFVVPGEDPASAALDVARTVVRRAERSLVRLSDQKMVQGGQLLPWLNRLSDVLFLLARAVERTHVGSRVDPRERGRGVRSEARSPGRAR